MITSKFGWQHFDQEIRVVKYSSCSITDLNAVCVSVGSQRTVNCVGLCSHLLVEKHVCSPKSQKAKMWRTETSFLATMTLDTSFSGSK